MKKLTMNRLAFSGIRANKKDYLLLGISAFLAIFAAVSTVLGTLALMQAATDRRNEAYGSEDAFVFDVQSVPENIPGVRQYGCVTVLGQVKDFPVGYYDEAAQRILNRRCMEGRLPEKAGEAAVDLTALERLQPGAQVGDSLVVPFTSKGKTETRQYRIVGILQPQFADDTREDFLSAVPDSSLAMPEILVSSQEGGSAVNRHLVVIFSGKFSGKNGMEALCAAFPENSCRGVGWFGDIYETEPFYGFWTQFRENINISASLLLGGACLLGGSLIGILEATGGQFDRKRQQYAIYRTIGATRHQLRSISSREAMVLSALLSPAAVGCAFLLVWGMCRIFPDSLHFAPKTPWILGAALGSFLLVWLAARLPALFSRTQAAAFQGPVLGFPKIRSRKRFHLASLWNARRFRFHPLRQLGCLLMIVILDLAIYGSVSEIFYQVQVIHSTKASYTDTQSIALERENFNTGCPLFTAERAYHIEPEVLEEIQALPGVADAKGCWYADAIGLTDRVGSYFEKAAFDNTQLYRDAAGKHPRAYAWHEALKAALGTEKSTMELTLLVLSDLSELEESTTGGKIDLAKIDAGEEVIVNVPEFYAKSQEDGIGSISYTPKEGYDPVENDQFEAGEVLPLVQLCLTQLQSQNIDLTTSAQALPFGEARVLHTEPKIGAVVNAERFTGSSCQVITTPQGLKNLGLVCDNTQYIRINNREDITKTQYDALRAALERIAAREDDVTVLDDRESQTSRTGSGMRRIVFFCGLSIAMLLLTVLLLCGSILRQIRAETRTLGTLRAVGCDERSLTQLFFRQIPETAGLAWLLVVGLHLFSAWGYLQYNWWEIRLNAITSIFTALLLTGLCYLVIRRQIKKLLEGSIVESIREE